MLNLILNIIKHSTRQNHRLLVLFFKSSITFLITKCYSVHDKNCKEKFSKSQFYCDFYYSFLQLEKCRLQSEPILRVFAKKTI